MQFVTTSNNGKANEILHCISKLYNLPVTVQHLQETGVGRTVNSFRKYDGSVGDASKALVYKWKRMVADEESSDGEDEDETCVPDVHESYNDNQESPKLEEIGENNSLSDQASNSKHVYKENKSEPSTKHNTMYSSKSKSEEKHEKSTHSSKHRSQSERKSKESKTTKSSLKEEAHSSTNHYHSSNDNSKKMSDKVTEINEDNNRKRKVDNSNSSIKESKKRKLSNSKIDDEKSELSISEKNSHSKSSGIEIEVKIKVKDEQPSASDKNKQDDKQKKYLQEKSRSSSNKLKSDESSSKAKDNSEKQKHKTKEHTSHSKYDKKKDSSHHSSKETSKSRVSSSSNKDHVKNKDRDKKKEHKEDKNKHEKKKETKIRLMQEIKGDEGIDCNSGASFAEALGMCTMPQPSKKRHNNSPNLISTKSIKTEPLSPPVNNKNTLKSEPEYGESSNPLSLLAPNVKLEPLSVDLSSTLPEISPNYKPLPYINPIQRKEDIKSVDNIIYVKNQRTKVYSGNKVGYTSVPTLYEMCIRVLIENIDALEFTGGVPYDILKPILERATPDQLFMLEHHNPYLIEDTDILWQYHCNREFRSNDRQEMESWREMYMRCLDEREAKLKTLTANIKQSIDKSVPVRSTKLAYVDSHIVKPPRNILKKQAKYGTANATPATISSVKKKLVGGGAINNATNIAVPPPPMARFKASTSSVKKTKAPLMAKALQLIKGRYKR
ncbi:transcription elongation factor B polypeptide 3 isoform X2 [Cataglyphis hispanica]|uniref:transcription elongation factor B polypeptide 3 isoform X2 n=1 Tax=Cataglyphis hispanica TaxID=1086592 RepID=UPI00218097E2|nr:transcription elongation factor B polypeptide 3 isoform X2 [Cataglyphis hispanica]